MSWIHIFFFIWVGHSFCHIHSSSTCISLFTAKLRGKKHRKPQKQFVRYTTFKLSDYLSISMPVPSCCTYCIRSGPCRLQASTIFILSHPIGFHPAPLCFPTKPWLARPLWSWHTNQVLCWAVYYPTPMPQQVPPTPLAKKKIGNLGCCPPRRVFIHQLLCPRHAKIPFPPFCRLSMHS